MNKFDNYISIGYVCNVISFLSQNSKRDTAYVFDRIGTPMWAIAELMENNFDNFLNKDNLKLKVLFDKSDKEFLIDSQYYVRLFNNSVGKPENVDTYLTQMSARKEKLLNLLTECNVENGKTILFIRCEEPTSYSDLGNRIALPEYANKYEHDELHYTIQFANTIKAKYPLLNFKILLLSKHGLMEDKANNIVGIPMPECDYRNPIIGRQMSDHIAQYNEYINSAFTTAN